MLRISSRALKTWAERDLTVTETDNGTMHCEFAYEGSSCNAGGHPFPATITCELFPETGGAWRLISAKATAEPNEEARSTLCIVRNHMGTHGVIADGELPLEGLELAEILNREWPVNNAGCFCTMAHVTHKVLLALHTFKWWIESSGRAGSAEA